MCGIVGIAGDIRPAEKKMFRDMLVMDQLRGFDSTGMITVALGPKQKPEIIKDTGPAQHLWEYEAPKRFDFRGVHKGNLKVMIGHNRAATIGKVTKENAHPFQIDHISGVHNGSLRQWNQFDPKNEFDVDSEALYNTMAKKGPDFVWKELVGAATLVWWDEKEEHLKMIRNSERPLYLHWSENGKTVFWASEWWMIYAAAMRNGVKLHIEKGRTAPLFHQISEHKLHTFKPTSIDCEQVEVRELEKKSLTTTYHHNNGGANTVGFKKEVKSGTQKVFQGEWKKNSKRCPYAPSNLRVTRLRSITQFTNKWEFFKGTLVKIEGGKEIYLGDIDVFPTTLNDVTYLNSVVRYGENLKLKGKPRIYNNKAVDSFCIGSGVCFVDPASSKNFLDKSKKENVTPLITHPKDQEPEEDCGSESDMVYMSPNGTKIDKATMESYLRGAGGTCAYCDGSLDPEESDELQWLNQNTCVCGECVANWGGNVHMLGSILGSMQ